MLASLFPRIDLTRGTHVDLDWPEFAARYLSRHDVRAQKDGQLFSFAVYHDHPQRADINVRAVTGIVIDFDNKTGVGNDARCIDNPGLPEHHTDNLDGLTYAYYSTHSSTATWPRWRLVIPLDREVLPHEWPAVFDGAHALLARDEGVDLTCRELSRAYYTPSVDPAHIGETFSGFVDGRVCRADELLDLSLVKVLPPNATPLRPDVQPGAQRAEGRNNHLKAVAAAMLGRAVPVESIVLELLREDAKHNPPLFTDPTEGFRGSAEAGALLFLSRIIFSLDARRMKAGISPDPLWLRDLNSAPLPTQSTDEAPFLLSLDDALANVQPPRWLIRGYLEQEAFAVLYGEPGAGKSFLALDTCLHLATGRAWHGKPVARCPVIYVCGEGRAGVTRRILAWSLWHEANLSDVPMAISRIAVPMFDPRAASVLKDELARYCEKLGGEAPGLVVFDTLARNFGAGDENKTSDMMQFIHNVYQAVIEPYGATALAVHHVGKDASKGARGSSSLRGAVDIEFAVRKCEGDIVELKAEKMKDAELPAPLNFSLRGIDLPMMDGGEPVRSVVPVALDALPRPSIQLGGSRRGPELPANATSQASAIGVLRTMIEESRQRLISMNRSPENARIKFDDWQARCKDAGVFGSREGWRKIKNALVERRLVTYSGGWVDLLNDPSEET